MGVIREAATEAEIRKLVQHTDETLMEAFVQALEKRPSRAVRARRKGGVDEEKLAEVLAYIRSLPRINEHLTDDEIIGYDEHGLPR